MSAARIWILGLYYSVPVQEKRERKSYTACNICTSICVVRGKKPDKMYFERRRNMQEIGDKFTEKENAADACIVYHRLSPLASTTIMTP